MNDDQRAALVDDLRTWICDCDAEGGIAEGGCDQLKVSLRRALAQIVTDGERITESQERIEHALVAKLQNRLAYHKGARTVPDPLFVDALAQIVADGERIENLRYISNVNGDWSMKHSNALTRIAELERALRDAIAEYEFHMGGQNSRSTQWSKALEGAK